MRRTLLLTFLVFAVAALTTAKGPMDKITITTPDGQKLDLTDPALTISVSTAQLEQMLLANRLFSGFSICIFSPLP